MKSTPGPWKAIRTEDMTWSVMDSIHVSLADNMSEQDARLIAAAPRMLEILRELSIGDDTALSDALPVLHAILADVGGESHG